MWYLFRLLDIAGSIELIIVIENVRKYFWLTLNAEDYGKIFSEMIYNFFLLLVIEIY